MLRNRNKKSLATSDFAGVLMPEIRTTAGMEANGLKAAKEKISFGASIGKEYHFP